MIVRAESFELRPADRDYNKHGKQRKPQMEILGGGLCYCLRTQFVYGLLIWEEGNKYMEIIKDRISQGDVPLGYDPYNKSDVDDVLPALPASYGVLGRIGTTVIFEKESSLYFPSSHGLVEGKEGDCVSLTFGIADNRLPHTPIKCGISNTITTLCDHDIGVIVYE